MEEAVAFLGAFELEEDGTDSGGCRRNRVIGRIALFGCAGIVVELIVGLFERIHGGAGFSHLFERCEELLKAFNICEHFRLLKRRGHGVGAYFKKGVAE